MYMTFVSAAPCAAIRMPVPAYIFTYTRSTQRGKYGSEKSAYNTEVRVMLLLRGIWTCHAWGYTGA